MDLRENLLIRPDVPNDEVDDVIELAAQLQDEARRPADRGATVAEVQAVAAELEIEPEFVEAAVGQRRRDAEQRRKARARRQTRVRRLIGIFVAANLVAVLAVAALGWSAARRLEPLRQDVLAAENALGVALDHQAAVGAQVSALGGADPAALRPLSAAFERAETVEDRLAAAGALSQAVSEQLGALPPVAGDAEATMRLNLQYEVTGARNRVDVEQRRWRDARTSWDEGARGPGSRIALAVGLADDLR